MGVVATKERKQQRGTVDKRPSGAVRVRVDTGTDPVTGKRHRVTEHIGADTPDLDAATESARARLVNEVNERRSPRTNATIGQLVEKHLDTFDGAYSTVENYRSLWANHGEPFIAKVKARVLDAEILDALYVECRRCRDHCTGPFTKHRTDKQHDCDRRCRPHKCKPLGKSGIRQLHWMLSGAYVKAKRWKWVSQNPLSDTSPGGPPRSNPQPPSARDAARMINEAVAMCLAWATLIWLDMTTGARRHELCALRWTDLEIDDGVATLWIRRGISKDKTGRWAELDTKTHLQRRVTLDAETLAVLMEHMERLSATLGALDLELAEDAFIFSPAVDHLRFYTPGAITQRFNRMVSRLRIRSTIHKLRHYSATELIKAGVDINTVAGRLGHQGGGTTTLKYYTGWVSEAEQRAAIELGARMPERNWQAPDAPESAKSNPQNPFEVVASAMRQQILDGELVDGAAAPSTKELAVTHEVSVGTAHRALQLLKTWNLVTDSGRGKRPTIVAPPVRGTSEAQLQQPAVAVVPPPRDRAEPVGRRAVDVSVVHLGRTVRTYRTEIDPGDTDELWAVLLGAIRRTGGDVARAEDYEMEIRVAGTDEVLSTYIPPMYRIAELAGDGRASGSRDAA